MSASLSAFIFRHFDVIDGWFQDQSEKDALAEISGGTLVDSFELSELEVQS